MKLTKEDFETLQDGLDALLEKEGTGDLENDTELLERIKNAENAIVTIGTY